jgi:coatomer protein complex subunit epsilon
VPKEQVASHHIAKLSRLPTDLRLGEPYSAAISFFTEQLANPSVSSAALLVGRGVVRILRGEVAAARSDLEEAESILSRAQTDQGIDEILAAMVVAVGLGAGKRGEAEEFWR